MLQKKKHFHLCEKARKKKPSVTSVKWRLLVILSIFLSALTLIFASDFLKHSPNYLFSVTFHHQVNFFSLLSSHRLTFGKLCLMCVRLRRVRWTDSNSIETLFATLAPQLNAPSSLFCHRQSRYGKVDEFQRKIPSFLRKCGKSSSLLTNSTHTKKIVSSNSLLFGLTSVQLSYFDLMSSHNIAKK